jgi:hypothetical protein
MFLSIGMDNHSITDSEIMTRLRRGHCFRESCAIALSAHLKDLKP